MPTPIPGTFQARNSISFSQIASEYKDCEVSLKQGVPEITKVKEK